MARTSNTPSAVRLTLAAETAADLMTDNPVSIRSEASVMEAVALLTDRGFSAAPVIDEAGRPIGVVSRADILVHDRESHRAPVFPEGRTIPEGFGVENCDPAVVGDIMTPGVFAVGLDTPAASVVEQLLALRVHRLFVVDADGLLVGVVSAVDVLRHLHA
jgi:CBS-domain-containing membrane protein